jgi:hypothetical protein
MISTFTSSDRTDPLINYLLLTDEERSVAPVPTNHIREKARSVNADLFTTFSFVEDWLCLVPSQLDLLCKFLDFMWSKTCLAFPNNRVDMRLVLPDQQFMGLLGILDQSPGHTPAEVWQMLKNSFHRVPGSSSESPKIALRMTRGPTNACIGFHCDGGYATATCQVALNPNTAYKGGRLCFFVNDSLQG